MNETNLAGVITALLSQTPVLVVSVVGLIISSLFYRKAPAAALWSAGAFLLVLGLCLVIAVGQTVLTGIQFTFMRATTYALLLIAIFAGRRGPAEFTTRDKSLWGVVGDALRRNRTPVGAFGMVFLIVLFVTLIFVSVTPPVYMSAAKVQLEPDPSLPSLASHSESQTQANTRFLKTEVEVMLSKTVLQNVIASLGLMQQWHPQSAQQALTVLKERIDVRQVEGTSLIEIRVYSRDPKEAANIANSIADSYRAHRSERRQSSLSEVLGALQSRAAELEQRVSEKQREIQKHTVVENAGNTVATKAEPATLAARQERDLDILCSIQKSMLERIEMARLELALTTTNCGAETVDPAMPAMSPVHPRKGAGMLAGVCTGVFLGLLAAALAMWRILAGKDSPLLAEASAA